MPGMGGVDPRQMAMMMRKMGIQVEEIEDVVEVVVRTKARDYRFRKAAVSVMKAQGQETWQVQGKAEVVEHGAAPSPQGAAPRQTGPGGAGQASRGVAAAPDDAPPAPIAQEDVRLVMEQVPCDERTAREALEATGGDLAQALIRLGK